MASRPWWIWRCIHAGIVAPQWKTFRMKSARQRNHGSAATKGVLSAAWAALSIITETGEGWDDDLEPASVIDYVRGWLHDRAKGPDREGNAFIKKNWSATSTCNPSPPYQLISPLPFTWWNHNPVHTANLELATKFNSASVPRSVTKLILLYTVDV